jgi:hypothetical protein
VSALRRARQEVRKRVRYELDKVVEAEAAAGAAAVGDPGAIAPVAPSPPSWWGGELAS